VFRIDTGNGTLYVTVGSSSGKPIEIFLSLGKSGQLLSTLSEALGRVISIALQGGVPIDNIVRTLVGINSDKPTWCRLDENDAKPIQILSIPDGLAQLLDRYYSDGKYNGVSVDTERCPNCGNPILMIEGCASCTCGYSRCG
jgi:ribonucleoside-diphosphate reductase alpha chain